MARQSSLIQRLRRHEAYDYVLPGYLLLCLLLGGASAGGFWANALIQLLALAILLWHAAIPSLRRDAALGRVLKAVLAVYVGWTLLMLIPLPASLWSHMGGRGFLRESYRVLGIDAPWRPLTLDPDRTLASILCILPFLAMLILAVASTNEGREASLFVLIAVSALSIVVGAFQVAGGADTRWYFYELTNKGAAVGFFANSNHLATLFLMAFPFLAALAARARAARSRRNLWSRQAPFVGAFVFLLLGLLLNGSTAGLLLLLPAVFGSLLVYRRAIGKPVPMTPVLAGVAILVVLIMFLVFGPLHSFLIETTLLTGSSTTTRETSIGKTLLAARDFLPFGSGLGTFRWLYTLYEDPNAVTMEYVSHAHNDYIEFALNLGLIGISLIVATFAWIASRSTIIWKGKEEKGSMARAGSVALIMLALHSLVDFPARTAAIDAVAAIAIGLLQAPRPRRNRLKVDREDARSDKSDVAPARHLRL